MRPTSAGPQAGHDEPFGGFRHEVPSGAFLSGGGGHASIHGRSSGGGPTFFSLVRSLVREHRSSYLVMGLTTFLASLLTSSTMQVYRAGKAEDGMGDLTGLNTYHRYLSRVPYRGISIVTIPALACCLLVSVFLVLSSVSFLVQERRREYGMMRLNGASRSRITALGLLEFSAPLAVSNLLGCLVGSLLTLPVGRFYAGSVEFDKAGMVFTPRIRFSVGVETLILMMGTCLLGVWMAMRKVAKASPLQLMQEATVRGGRIGWIRSLAFLVLLALTLVVGFAPLPSLTLDMRSMLEVILVITTVYLGAPFLVALSVSIIGLIPAKVAGGPGLLARQRARRESAGSTAIALPAMMILTILISFVAVMQAGSIGGAVLQLEPLKADVIVSSTKAGDGYQDPTDLIRGMAGVRASNTYYFQNWMLGGSEDQSAIVVWESSEQTQERNSDISRFTQVLGNLSDLGPGRIAVSEDSGYSLGDRVRLLDRQDREHEARIVAVVQPPQGIPELTPLSSTPLFLTVDDALPRLGEDGIVMMPILASDRAGKDRIVSRLRNENMDGLKVQTRQEYIDDFIQRGLTGQVALTVMVVGGTVLALIFMMQSIAIAAGERRGRNRRLHQNGVSRASIVWSAVMETLTDVVGGAVMALLAVAMVEGCLALGFTRSGMSAFLTPVPVLPFLVVTAVLLIVATLTTVLCNSSSDHMT